MCPAFIYSFGALVCYPKHITDKPDAIKDKGRKSAHSKEADRVIFFPPSVDVSYCLAPDPLFIQWIRACYAEGYLLCSACAGSFLLAAAGLLDGRPATTHWNLAGRLHADYPQILLRAEEMIVNDGDIITAGGLMAWLDLCLELIMKFAGPRAVRLLGKLLVIDTAPREQRYYQHFDENLFHGDENILAVQHYIHTNFCRLLTIKRLARIGKMSQRTFLRRFLTATAWKPTAYLQKYRIQKACDLLESTSNSVESIALQVGYRDVSAFRRMFIKVTGLTPSGFKRRFVFRQTNRR